MQPRKRIRRGVEAIAGVDARRKIWHYAEWVIEERKDCNLRSWSLENRDAVSQHRGLSSGVASGKSAGSRWAYGWVETSTPLSSCITPLVLFSYKCFFSGILKYICIYVCSNDYAHKLWNCEWIHCKNVCRMFWSVLLLVYLYGRDYVWHMSSWIVIYMRNDLIQTSCLVLGWMIPLSTSDSTLSEPPHRDAFLEKPIKNRERGCEGVRP